MVETWISHGAFEKSDEFKSMIAKMSQEDLDLQLKKKHEDLLKKVEALQGSYSNNINAANWKDANFDDSHWSKMKLPGLWETQKMGLEGLEGLVLFRITIVVDDVDAGKPAVLVEPEVC